MATNIKPGMWIVTREDEVLYFTAHSGRSNQRKGLFHEYDETGRRGYCYELPLGGLKPAPRQDYEMKLGCDDLAHNLVPNLAELSDNVVHFNHEHVCVTMEFGGKRFAVQITEKM